MSDKREDMIGSAMSHKFKDGDKFGNPYLMHSNLYIPNSFQDTLRLALTLAVNNPTYFQATKRVVSHFVTDVECVGMAGDERERKELHDYLVDELGLMGHLMQAGLETLIYGNSFIWIYYPFDRLLIHGTGDTTKYIPVDAFGSDIKYNYRTMTYNVPDPMSLDSSSKAKKRLNLPFVDRRCEDRKRIKVRFLSPLQVEIRSNTIAGTADYIYRLEEFFISDVKEGTNIKQVNDTPKAILEAVKLDQHYIFNSGAIFHLKSGFISGVTEGNWGMPNAILNYASIHNMQVLEKINETICLDYMQPTRVISPTSSVDTTSMPMLARQVKKYIAMQRKDPTNIFFLPTPVNMQEINGSGRSLAPVDLIQHQASKMVTGMGYPAQLMDFSLQTQQAPYAMRTMEAGFTELRRGMDGLTRWITKSIREYLKQDDIEVRLQKPTIADNTELKHVMLQLASGGELSRATVYKQFGIENVMDESEKRMREDMEKQRISMKVQQDFEREQTLGSGGQVLDAMIQSQQPPPQEGGGQAGPPMAAQGAAPGAGVNPLDIIGQATSEAQRLLGMPVGDRRKELNNMKATNETLYALVKQKMEEMRSQGESQGRQQVAG